MERISLPLSASCIAVLLCYSTAWAGPPPPAAGAASPFTAREGCTPLMLSHASTGPAALHREGEDSGERGAARSEAQLCGALGDSELDALRGGYDMGEGLRVSFGIERATYINGELRAHSAFHIPDLRQITPEQAQGLGAVLGRVQLVQNGPGNTYPLGQIPTTFAGTVIQNTLNDQIIQQWTTLSTETNSLQMLRNHNALSTLREVLTSR